MNYERWYDEDAPVAARTTTIDELPKQLRSYFLAAKAQGADDVTARRYAEEMFEAVGF